MTKTSISLITIVLGSAVFAGGEAPRAVFVTSVSGDVILGSWPDADDQTGLAAANRICQNRAVAGGLANPGNFVAWISDSSDDAYCRLHGLSGKKSGNCGQVSLPVAAGPWVRTDGFPFAPAIDQLLDPENIVYAPPVLDEFGNRVNWPWYTLTATQFDGTLGGNTCGDWTDPDGGSGLYLGDPTATSGSWTRGAGSTCAGTGRRLLCLERPAGPSLPEFAQGGRLAFVTSATGTGDLGAWPEAGSATGLAAADATCRTLAADAGLPHSGSFKAWLSDAGTDAIDRFEHDGRWVRLDGVVVAQNKDALISDSEFLFTAIGQTEQGEYVAQFADTVNVWTGTLADGTGSSAYCGTWDDGTDTQAGTRGQAVNTPLSWTQFSTMPCDFGARLYCLSDLDPFVFSDRFED